MKLLVIVDFQNDYVIGSLGYPEAEQLEAPILRKIQSYLLNEDEVVFILDRGGSMSGMERAVIVSISRSCSATAAAGPFSERSNSLPCSSSSVSTAPTGSAGSALSQPSS